MLTLLIIKCPLEFTAIQQLFCYFVVGINLMYLFLVCWVFLAMWAFL